MAEAFLGEIRAFAGSFAPQGWAPCNGQQLPISTYSALYAVIGSAYGGNGISAFALPNLNDSAPVGQGAGPGLTPKYIGKSGGTMQAALNANQIPAHTHQMIADSTSSAASASPVGNLLETAPKHAMYAAPDTGNTQLAASSIGISGSSAQHPNMQPSLAFIFCICIDGGIFPSRN